MTASSPRIIKLTVAYDGTAYGGWQRQANAPTVQAELEDRLRRMTREPRLTLAGAGRTDSGVHALGQVTSFRTRTTIPVHGFQRGINRVLPRDIAIMEAEDAPADFDARRSARGKLYRYRILNRYHRDPLRERFVWLYRKPLIVEKMQEACAPLVGEHDFSAFRSADCGREKTIRHLHRVEVSKRDDEIVIEVEGNAFLRNMVRIIVGTLVAAGRGELTVAELTAVRDGLDRTRAGVTAPPQGLILVRVDY